jgi:dTDP-L-rhamnose 4-epimerase
MYANPVRLIIVTGGFGFIGRNLVSELARRDSASKVLIVDNLDSRVHKTLPQNPTNVDFLVGDIGSSEIWNDLNSYVQNINGLNSIFVFHLASDTATASSGKQPSRTIRTNDLGTARLLEWASSQVNSIERIVLASSRAIYGEGSWLTFDGEIVSPEPRMHKNLKEGDWRPFFGGVSCVSPQGVNSKDCKPKPTSIYGLSKLNQEQLLEIWAQSFEVPFSILRLQNVYGPGQSLTNSYSGIVALFVRRALVNETLEVYEDGEILRDFVYVSDVVEVLLDTLAAKEEVSILDVGTTTPTALIQLAHLICDVAESQSNIEITKKFRIGDVRSIYANDSILRGRQITDLRTGVEKTINWARLL